MHTIRESRKVDAAKDTLNALKYYETDANSQFDYYIYYS